MPNNYGNPQIITPIGDGNKDCKVAIAWSVRNFNGDLSVLYEWEGTGTYDPERNWIISSQIWIKDYIVPMRPPYYYDGRANYSSAGFDLSKSNDGGGVVVLSGQAKNICLLLNNYYGADIYDDYYTPKKLRASHRYNIVYSGCPDRIPLSFSPTPSPVLTLIYLGTASPPPPPPKNMNCCDCNTIATIIADQMADQFRLFESIKDHIDLRTKEEIQMFRKQLEALEIDLQPIIDRLNEVEKNLWNGIE